MIKYNTEVKKFGSKGEKTGWTYIEVDAEQAFFLNPKVKTSYRVKGKINQINFEGIAMVPMGNGDFILSLNAAWRKKLEIEKGMDVEIEIELDRSEILISKDLLDCFEQGSKAKWYFESIPPSHRKYYSNWIESAKTIDTKTKRILQTIQACELGMNYAEMIRHLKGK